MRIGIAEPGLSKSRSIGRPSPRLGLARGERSIICVSHFGRAERDYDRVEITVLGYFWIASHPLKSA